MGKKLTGALRKLLLVIRWLLFLLLLPKKQLSKLCGEGNRLNPVLPEIQAEALVEIRIPSILGAVFGEIYDPQGVLIQPNVSNTSIRSKVNDHLGHHTFFVRMKQGQMEWWQPVNVQITKSEKSPVILPFSQVNTSECRVMNMDSLFNANVTDIFRNEYLTPQFALYHFATSCSGHWRVVSSEINC